MGYIKTVFHIHTNYSDDSEITVDGLIEHARRAGVHCLAVTDHDTIEGARRVAAMAGNGLQVIIGEEVSTRDGHLIGLFVQEHIQPGESARRTAELIRRQGGLVVVPHPFNHIFGCSLGNNVFDLLELVDVVEIANSQNLLPYADRKARRFAAQFSFPGIVGSDTHHRGYLDSCYQWLPAFDGPEGFKASLRQGAFVLDRHPLYYFAKSACVVLRDNLGLGAPRGYGRNCTRVRPVFDRRPAMAPAE